MLNHQLLTFDENGHVRCTLEEAPADFNGGTPIFQGLLCLTEAPPEFYLGGLTYVANGAASATQDLNPANDNPLMASNGRLSFSPFVTGIAWYWCGLPFTADGRLAVSFGLVPPPASFAFNNGFGADFDSPNAP
jgi:hypothetical protein